MLENKLPFVAAERETQDPREFVNCGLNKEERQMLDEIKQLLDIKEDSTALKLSARIGLNVTRNIFKGEQLRISFKK